jgi:hypothetical protein
VRAHTCCAAELVLKRVFQYLIECTCHHIYGCREKRNKAVLKGMKYMKKFLLKDNCKALYEIGDDAPSIFFEIWYNTTQITV